MCSACDKMFSSFEYENIYNFMWCQRCSSTKELCHDGYLCLCDEIQKHIILVFVVFQGYFLFLLFYLYIMFYSCLLTAER